MEGELISMSESDMKYKHRYINCDQCIILKDNDICKFFLVLRKYGDHHGV